MFQNISYLVLATLYQMQKFVSSDIFKTFNKPSGDCNYVSFHCIFENKCMLQLYLWHIIYANINSIELVYEIFPPLFPIHFVNRFHLLNNSEPHIIERMSW